jgi:hypothetical protein
VFSGTWHESKEGVLVHVDDVMNDGIHYCGNCYWNEVLDGEECSAACDDCGPEGYENWKEQIES